MWKTEIDEFWFKFKVDRYKRPTIYSVGVTERENRENVRQ